MKRPAQLLLLLLTLQLASCGGSTQEQSARDSLQEAEEALESADDALKKAGNRIEGATDVLNRDKIYCCSNHDPGHCGTALEIEQLVTTNGCSGFEEEGMSPQ